MLSVTREYAAPETMDAVKHAAALAEKSGNLTELLVWVGARCVTATISGDFRAAVSLADQALQLALREGSPESSRACTLSRLHHAFSLATSRAPRKISRRGSRSLITPVSGIIPCAAS